MASNKLLDECLMEHKSLVDKVRRLAATVTPEDEETITFLNPLAIGDRELAIAVQLGMDENGTLPEDQKKAVRDCQAIMGISNG